MTKKPTFNDLLRDRILKYLGALPDAVAGKSGHKATYYAARVLVWGFCLPRDEALEYLREYNRRCSPLWTEEELAHKIDSAIESCNRRWRAGTEKQPPGYLRCYWTK
jgi:hypothetical protein